jgi:hypothetical protein
MRQKLSYSGATLVQIRGLAPVSSKETPARGRSSGCAAVSCLPLRTFPQDGSKIVTPGAPVFCEKPANEGRLFHALAA